MEVKKLEVEGKDNGTCFGCGKENPIGLKLNVKNDNGKARAVFIPGEFHQGWGNIVHGGLLYVAMDEVGGYAVLYNGVKEAVTAKSDTRFFTPARIGEELEVTATVTKMSSRLIETETTIQTRTGTLIATNHSLWYKASSSY